MRPASGAPRRASSRGSSASVQLKDENGGERLGLAADLELDVGGERRPVPRSATPLALTKVPLRAPDADQDAWGVIRVQELRLIRSTLARVLADSGSPRSRGVPLAQPADATRATTTVNPRAVKRS